MGEVFEAEDLRSGTRVAIKASRRPLDGDVDRARFLREGRLEYSASGPTCRMSIRTPMNAILGYAQLLHVVTMAVEDTGPGIGPEHLTRIFDAFDQADSTARIGGTGSA